MSVLTASGDQGTLWSVATGQPLGPPLLHGSLVMVAAYSPDGKTVLTGSSDLTARLWAMTELPDDPERVSAWLSKATALGLDDRDDVQLLDRAGLETSLQRLKSLGSPPLPKARASMDPILFGIDPAARARAWIRRGRWDDALAAFDESLRARPLHAPLWAERARFHESHSRLDQSIDDAAQAVLVCWNDPRLAALARSDTAFRDEALNEILQMHIVSCRAYPEVWRGRGRRFAARGDWASALREFVAPATPVPSIPAPDLLAQACLLRLAGDDEGTKRFGRDVRELPDPIPRFFVDGSPFANPDDQIPVWVRLLEDPSVDPADLVQRAERYFTTHQGEAKYVLGAALLRAGRLDEAVHQFEESLIVERDWPNSGLNAFGLALAHHRLGHSDQARGWLDNAESWLNPLDQIYAAEAPGIHTGQPRVSVSFEFWIYAQVLRRQVSGQILDANFPSNPFAR
jgi:tetratricopeptide (TPR) repeat protein